MNWKLSDKQIKMIFVFIFPITPLYYEVFGIYGLNIICFLFIGIVLIIGHLKIRFTIPSNFLLLSFMGWISGRLLSYVMSGNFMEIIFFLLRTAGIYFVLNYTIRCKADFLCLIKAVILSGVFVSCFGIVEEVTRFNIFSFIHPTGELNYNPLRFGMLRIISFSSHTIVYGVYLMFVMSLCLYYFQFIKKNKRIRNRYLVAYILLWVNMLFTLSRSIIICAFLSQVLILYFIGGRKSFLFIIKSIMIAVPILVVLVLIVPSVRNIISNIFYMILAVFNTRYSSNIAGTFGNDNLFAYGNRFDLYGWVAQELQGNWMFGKGMNASFSHAYLDTDGIYTWTAYKTSIEVQYLNILFHYGLVGIISESLMYLTVLLTALKNRKKNTFCEVQIGFNSIAVSIFLMYFIEFFAVNQSSDQNIFYIFLSIFIIYNTKRFKYSNGGAR